MGIRIRIRIPNTSYRCLLPFPFFLFCSVETAQQMRETYLKVLFPIAYMQSLKVGGNEKLGRSKRRQQWNFFPALWRSRVILNLNVSFLCKQYISFSAGYSFINRRCHDEYAKRGQIVPLSYNCANR
jgi:hypothetical protein